ncbi:MAG: hypothetical protein Q4C47_02660, partial [Planctomycetia bacterium]|nr:hypothetical protein [Planctomycetia bacterium]
CTSVTTSSLYWWKKEEPSEHPTRVVEFWKEDVLTVDGVTTRGFGGRLVFYDSSRKKKNDEHDRPVKITGRLTVYAFDDSDYEQGSSAAEKKFVFEPEQLEKAYRETSLLGHSYCFWLPWDSDMNAPRKKICLIAILEDNEGRPVLRSTEANRVQLPGCSPAKTEKPLRGTEVRKSRIVGEDATPELMSHAENIRQEWSTDSRGRNSGKRKTETIPLNPNGSFARPGAPGAEQPSRTVRLPDIHRKKTDATTTGRTDDSSETCTDDSTEQTTRKSQRTRTVLNGPLNDDTTSVDSLNQVLHNRNGLTIGQVRQTEE